MLTSLSYSGHPKGVMLSHTNIVSNVCMLIIGEGGNLSWKGGNDDQGDKIIAFLPFFHIYVWFNHCLRRLCKLTRISRVSHVSSTSLSTLASPLL